MQTDSLIQDFSAVVETVQKHKRQGLALAAAALVLALAVAIALLTNISNPIVALFFSAFALFGVVAFLQRRYKSQVARTVMPLLADQIDGITYEGLGTPALSLREFETLLPKGRYDGDHVMLSGRFGALWFQQANVVLKRQRGKNTETTFHGVVLRLPPLGISEELVVQPTERQRGAIAEAILGSNAPLPSEKPIGPASIYSAPLTLYAQDSATAQEHAPLLTKLIDETNALFVDSATVEAVFATPESTLLAVADGALPFHIGGLLQPRSALEAEIEAASAELAAPIKIMQIWSEAAVTARPSDSQ